jgi:hypothetical protein
LVIIEVLAPDGETLEGLSVVCLVVLVIVKVPAPDGETLEDGEETLVSTCLVIGMLALHPALRAVLS